MHHCSGMLQPLFPALFSPCLSPPPQSLAGSSHRWKQSPRENRSELNSHQHHCGPPEFQASPSQTRARPTSPLLGVEAAQDEEGQPAQLSLRIRVWLQSWGLGHSRQPGSWGGKTTGTQEHNLTHRHVLTRAVQHSANTSCAPTVCHALGVSPELDAKLLPSLGC